MSNAEYVGLSNAEKNVGSGNLLRARLELLNILKSFKVYRTLRSEELILKVNLKAKLEEAIVLADKLQKALPRTSFIGEKKKTSLARKEEMELQAQIDEVREKLSRLSARV